MGFTHASADDNLLNGATDLLDRITSRRIPKILTKTNRRSLTGGGLATTIFIDWLPAAQHAHHIQHFSHYTGLGLAAIVTTDLIAGLLAKIYRSLRGKIIIIDPGCFTDPHERKFIEEYRRSRR